MTLMETVELEKLQLGLVEESELTTLALNKNDLDEAERRLKYLLERVKELNGST